MSGYLAVAGAKARENKHNWYWHIASLCAVTGLILITFQFEVVNAVQVWWIYPTYSHCFLVIPISAWLVWEKREALAHIAPAIAPKALFAILPLLLVWLAGKFSTINEVRQFAVIGLIEVSILVLMGWRIFATILFPALYLFFLVPAGQYLIPPMQQFATEFTNTGLSLLNIPHYTEGTIIELPNARFEVAEACAGLRFLIATIAVGTLFAHLTYTKTYKIIAFLAACIVLPLIANGFRCLGIIVLAYATNNAAAVDADHILYGWIFNVAILSVLGFVGSLYRDAPKNPIEVLRVDAQPVSPKTLLALAAGTTLAILVGPALTYWHDARPVVANADALAPLSAGTWTVERPDGTWRPFYDGSDLEFITSFVPGSSSSSEVDVAIEYYGRIREGRSLVAATNRLWNSEKWYQTGTGNVVASIGSEPLQLKEAIISSASGKRLVWATYWMDGQFTNSALMIKLLQLKTLFLGNESAALIALSTPIDGAQEEARARLKTVLMSLSDLSTHLVDAGRPGAASKAFK